MPVYEYRCQTCDTRFEARRPMSEASAPINCPDGHLDTTRLLSVFASVGHGSEPAAMPAGGAGPVGGGCGPGCACMS
jgi:putative FmdB family regulatory protein